MHKVVVDGVLAVGIAFFDDLVVGRPVRGARTEWLIDRVVHRRGDVLRVHLGFALKVRF